MDNYDAIRLENQLCFPLYAASREIIKQYRPYLDALDLTYTQYIAMMVFWSEKKVSVKELGKKLYLDSGTLTPVLKNLEKKGLVSRYRSERDERVLIVELTEKGEALKARAVDIPGEVVKCIRLSSDEATQLHALLNRVLSAFPTEFIGTVFEDCLSSAASTLRSLLIHRILSGSFFYSKNL